MHREIQDNERVALDLLSIAKIHFNKGRLDSAEIYSTESLEIASNIESVILIADISQLRYELFKVQGDNKAFEMLEMMVTNRDRLKNEEIERNVIRQEFKHEYDLKKSLDEKQKKVDEKLNRIKITSISIALGVVIIFFFFYRSNVIKKRKIRINQIQLAANEKEILELKIHEESINFQLLNLELSTKKEYSETILERLQAEEILSPKGFNSFKLFMKNEIEVKSTRAQLQNQIGNVSGNFHNSLKIKFPELSAADLKLAAMVVMNMDNKEIAINKNMTAGSVRTIKSRLKIKMNLSKEDDLNAFLKKYL